MPLTPVTALFLSFAWSHPIGFACVLPAEHGQNSKSDNGSVRDTALESINANQTFHDASNKSLVDYNGSTIDCDPTCNDDLLEVCRLVNGDEQWMCDCPENVDRDEFGKCTVFNECSDETSNNCSSLAFCIDLPDGYTCQCKDGYADTVQIGQEELPGRNCILHQWTVNDTDSTALLSTNISSNWTSLNYISQGEFLSENVTSQNDRLADAPFDENMDRNDSRADQKGSATVIPSQLTRSVRFMFSNSTLSILNTSNSFQKSTKDQFNFSSSPADGLTDTRLKTVFTAFDMDNDGQISGEELKKAVDLFGLELSDDDVMGMIKVADQSGEGLVDLGEFTTLMRKSI